MTAVLKSGTITVQYSGGGTPFTATRTKTGSARVSIEEDVPTESTDLQFASMPSVDVSSVAQVYISATQACTIETNAIDATGGNTLTFGAGGGWYYWDAGCLDTLKLTEDIDAGGVYVTNASGATSTVSIEIILDTTPA